MRPRSALKQAWCSNAARSKSAPSSRLMRAEQIEIELRGDAGGVVIGAIENVGRLDEIDADDEQRSRPEHARGVAQKLRRLVRLEIADGRAGKEADPPHARKRSRQLGDRGEIGGDRVDGEPRQIAAQLRRFLLQILARNVDRHIGFDRRRRIDENARLAARSGAELDQGAVLREQRRHRRRMLAQKRHLAARRIIFRQPRDLIEQHRPRRVVEVFRRQPFRLGGQAGENVGGEWLERRGYGRRAEHALRTRGHGAAQRPLKSASRRPQNCQRAGG